VHTGIGFSVAPDQDARPAPAIPSRRTRTPCAIRGPTGRHDRHRLGGLITSTRSHTDPAPADVRADGADLVAEQIVPHACQRPVVLDVGVPADPLLVGAGLGRDISIPAAAGCCL